MNHTTKQELLCDMSAAWAGCNSALQELDHAAHKSPFGAGKRRARSAARRVEAEIPTEAAEAFEDYVEALR